MKWSERTEQRSPLCVWSKTKSFSTHRSYYIPEWIHRTENPGKCLIFLSAFRFMKEFTREGSHMCAINMRSSSIFPLILKIMKEFPLMKACVNVWKVCMLVITEKIHKLEMRFSINTKCERAKNQSNRDRERDAKRKTLCQSTHAETVFQYIYGLMHWWVGKCIIMLNSK